MPRIAFDGPNGPESVEVAWNLQTGQLRLMLAEARHIQRVADLTVEQLRERVFMTEDTDPVALTALVQVLWKRQGRDVPFDQIDFDLGSVEFDLLPDEAAFAERMEKQEQQVEGADAEDPTQTPNGPPPTEG